VMTDWEHVSHQTVPVTYVPLSNGWKAAFIGRITAPVYSAPLSHYAWLEAWMDLPPTGPATLKSYRQRRLMHAATDKARPR